MVLFLYGRIIVHHVNTRDATFAKWKVTQSHTNRGQATSSSPPKTDYMKLLLVTVGLISPTTRYSIPVRDSLVVLVLL